MPRIDRPAVRPNLATVSDLRLAGLRVGSPFASMTVPTQALQRAQQEAIPVAVMRLDVIGDRGGDDMSLLAADPAYGLEPELMLRSLAPALQRVPISPGHGLRGSERELGHGRSVARRFPLRAAVRYRLPPIERWWSCPLVRIAPASGSSILPQDALRFAPDLESAYIGP
jgi:hypothetical protein